jgi:hypothetical protein
MAWSKVEIGASILQSEAAAFGDDTRAESAVVAVDE